ncbi:hypothetical protein [[Mycoplasma] gypis]|uniref:Uncharacterized protein n=1 Tax=[Mycoplasma] gypis TaxID=92404 RepID=A0ABZ2RR00_9BACT|nr:hypothetical protein [[Mycoplasma] gypis]MBN0919337.1 hypothetical protein [[Mycoplasma] gypis]
MTTINRALVPIFNKKTSNLLLFKNPEFVIWTQIYSKEDFEKNDNLELEELNINPTDFDKQVFGDAFIEDKMFFISSTKIYDQILNPGDTWNMKDEKSNFGHSNVITYLLERFSTHLNEKQPQACFVLVDIDPKTPNSLRPFYIWADKNIVEQEYQNSLNTMSDESQIKMTKYINEVELPKANNIYLTNEGVKNYIKRIKIFSDHFISVSKKA